MIRGIILSWCVLHVSKGVQDRKAIRQAETRQECLTGYMTDVQKWVDEKGNLTAVEPHHTIDVSSNPDMQVSLYQEMNAFSCCRGNVVKYLSMANNRLSEVPSVFQIITDVQGRSISDTVKYMTLYGNEFIDISTPGEQYGIEMNATGAREVTNELGLLSSRPGISPWAAGFHQVIFRELLELDLRQCSIQILNENLFQGMPRLEALYLGENRITLISTFAFNGLKNLKHLDISRNLEGFDSPLVLESTDIFLPLTNLTSLDLSFTKLEYRDADLVKSLSRNIERLSLCYTGLMKLPDHVFNETKLKYLDVSGNNGILANDFSLAGIENTLQVLYADEIGLKSCDKFEDFKKLEVLKLRNNELNIFTQKVAISLESLQILDLDKNRLNTWFIPTFSVMVNLKLLTIRHSNINLITQLMLDDLLNVPYIAISDNSIVCSCQVRDFFDLAYQTETNTSSSFIRPIRRFANHRFSFHTGFLDFNERIKQRTNITRFFEDTKSCGKVSCPELESAFLLLDFHPEMYQCLEPEGGKAPFSEVDSCFQKDRGFDYGDRIQDGWNKLFALLVIPIFILPVLVFVYVFRRNLRYFCITIRNSATLSLINTKDVVDDGTIFNYDVFVSYCNDDRDWVLDHLLPHVEQDCNIRVCLHERDFQVGLSILENIVSCMDRSRFIMLLISQKFLLSQWCQFEMHLAQHRLLETRREDLILILLEEIPRRQRPTTLHYLMLTKTYLVWPKDQSEQAQFWRRLKRSLISYRIKQIENISLA